ncbi:MAG: 4Fe-4S binding protein [Candidatus Moduliflexus flocculans]|nr:4Fe-4S binding protein [Candidatus Moduliflexus flocculans]
MDKESCAGCGKCVEVCPPQALILTDNIAHLREELCEECGLCAPECHCRMRLQFISPCQLIRLIGTMRWSRHRLQSRPFVTAWPL